MTGKKDKAVLMTSGPIGKQIIGFALPVFWGNLFQQLYNMVDSLIVGNFCGKDALAAVSSAGHLIFMLNGLIFGIFAGAGVVISKYYGAKDIKSVQNSIHTTLAMGVIAGIFMTIVGVGLTPQILVWMNTPASVLPNSVVYFRIYFMGSIAMVMYNTAAGIFQAVGDSRHPLYYLMASSITNVILDLLFVWGFNWGIGGAAFATILSQTLSCVLAFSKLAKSEETYRVHFRKIKIHGHLVGQILRMGIPSGIQNSVIGFANIIVQSNINAFGEAAVAGCGTYSKIEGFAFLPITSFSMALTTFTGQNSGAKQYDRVKKGAKFGIFGGMVCAEVIGILMFIFMPILISAFNREADVIAYGTLDARTCTLFYFLLAFSHCAAGVMRGAGKAYVPMVVMLVCWCLIRVTYITIATNLIPDIQMIFWAYPITWSLSGICFLWYLIKGDWAKPKEEFI